jgi:streptogramin lyase
MTAPFETCYQARAAIGVPMRYRAALIAAVALSSACERKTEAPPSEPTPDAPVVAEVAAADSYGVEGERVYDIAFWSHPGVVFESLLLAAADDRITAYRIETGEQKFEIPGGAQGVELFYAGVGAGATGYLLADSGGAYRLNAISQDGAGFNPIAMANAGVAGAAFCASGGPAPVIYEIVDGKISARTLTIVANGAELGAARAVAAAPNAIACHVDPLSDNVITVSGDGAIRRIDPATGAVFGLALPAGISPVASGLAAGRTEAGDPVAQVALLDADSGSAMLFDAVDGHALGSVRIKATFDLDAVKAATRLAIGSANYGGVYRDGALAVVTSGDGAPIRLAPWNGVMGALSLPVAAVPDPRTPNGAAAEESVISIEVIEP